jgi:NAD(P)-dependent dehydrogenase (short-subunit alcohol dehydrogenase family)
MELSGRIALVTGAGSGLGRGAALAMAREGADLILVSRTEEELQAVAAEIERLDRRADYRALDVSDDAAMRDLFAWIGREHGRLDAVFANAGINGVWAPIDELQPDEWDNTIRINLRGTYLTLHFAVPLMKRHGGAVVITSSINGTRTFTTGGASAYSTTKAGQVALAQMLALELAQYRIRVNVICPGSIESDIAENTTRRHAEQAKVPAIYPEGTVPLTKGKPGTAAQVGDLVAFLVSEKAAHISGTPIYIDGAQSLLV